MNIALFPTHNKYENMFMVGVVEPNPRTPPMSLEVVAIELHDDGLSRVRLR